MKSVFLPVLVILSLFLGSCTHVFYQGDRRFYLDPRAVKLKEENVFFKNSQGKTLHAWHFKAATENYKGLVILFHGNAENLSSHYLNLAWLTEQGFDLFVFDYQGYGRSEGESSQENTIADGVAALDQAHQTFQTRPKKTNSKFIVFGQSLGGAIAARSLQDFKNLSHVNLLVMDSTFVSYQDMGRRKLASHWVTWLFSPLAYILVSDKYSAEESITKLKIPILVMHDEKENIVPIATAEEFYETLPEPKEFWRFSRGYHCGSLLPDEKENRKRLISKFDSL